eukprot:3427676-Karenia_brevis.AAC.2
MPPLPERRCHSARLDFDVMPMARRPARSARKASLTAAGPAIASVCSACNARFMPTAARHIHSTSGCVGSSPAAAQIKGRLNCDHA